MAIWDFIGNISKFYKDQVNQSYPGAAQIKFGQAIDIADKLPKNESTLEEARQAVVGFSKTSIGGKIVAGAGGAVVGGKLLGLPGLIIGAGAGLGISESKTAGKLLMTGTNEVRSNYAYTRALADDNLATAMLSTFTAGIAGIAGAAAGLKAGGIRGVKPGFALGVAAEKKLERMFAQTDVAQDIEKNLNKAALIAESADGQERYNFGRDVVSFSSAVRQKVIGGGPAADLNKGAPAIASGFINAFLEWGPLAPDMAAFTAGGAVLNRAAVAPVATSVKSRRTLGRVMTAIETKQLAADRAKNFDLIQRAANGETNRYTPVMEFIEKSDAATLTQHPLFQGESNRVAATIFAGQTKETQALLFGAAQGYSKAIEALRIKAADKALEINKFEGAYNITYINGVPTMTHPKVTQKAILDSLERLRKEEVWLDDALSIRSTMQMRTVAKSSYIEKLRIDTAENKLSRNLETGVVGPRMTAPGRILQTIYQSNGLGTPIRFMNRLSDDAPHSTVNFNDVVNSQDRVRTNIRSAVKYGGIDATESQNWFNQFVKATNETDKFAVVERLNSEIIKNVSAKYGISDLMAEEIISAHNKNNRIMITNAKSSKELKQAFMFDPADPTQLLHDPQLVSQLANGSYLVDVKNMDAALARWAGENKLKRFTGSATKEQTRIEAAAYLGKDAADYVLAQWRGLTLMRAGYPMNIIRDSSLRLWGTMDLLSTLMQAGEDFLKGATKGVNTVQDIKYWRNVATNPKARLKHISREIDRRNIFLTKLEANLKTAGYDVNNPPAKYNVTDLQNSIDSHAELQQKITDLRIDEAALLTKFNPKTANNSTFEYNGTTYETARAGRFGEMLSEQIYGQHDLRRALSSSDELAIQNASRGRSGSKALVASTNEKKHLQAWESVLNNQIRFDEVARFIMEQRPHAEIIAWLNGPAGSAGFNYRTRMGYNKQESARYITQVEDMLDWFTPSQQLRDSILKDTLDIKELVKQYPDVNSRPDVLTDVIDDGLGLSSARKIGLGFIKDAVAWMATQPTGRLINSPYFEVAYQQKIQELASVATLEGRILTKADSDHFSKIARGYAINKQRNTLNAFHRDMNYNGITSYMMAFFPALVEQFRAYGRITYDHPEFIVKAARLKMLPESSMEVKTDQYGEEYVEANIPFFGLKGRFKTSWFDPLNPTGGSILSAGPVLSVPYNELAKRVDMDGQFSDLVLPFGVQANSLNALKPNTVKKFFEAWGGIKKNGETFNKDANMLFMQERKDFNDEFHRQPTQKEFAKMQQRAADKASSLSILRFVSSLTLPSQPRYVTPITAHADILGKLIVEHGQTIGTEMFIDKYPDFFLLATSLSDSTSGINPNKTTMALVKNNSDTILKITSIIGSENLGVLGSIFRDDNGEFSKQASIYLEQSDIPGVGQKFKNYKDYVQSNRANIVAEGWNDWSNFNTIVKDAVETDGYTVASGYGKAVLDAYKEQFIEGMKEKNPMWYADKTAGPALALSKLEDTVSAVTIALSTPKMWKVLSKQPVMHTIAEYMSLRYDVNQVLNEVGGSYSSERMDYLREKVVTIVEDMKSKDINFKRWHERYFDNDDFSYVYTEGQ